MNRGVDVAFTVELKKSGKVLSIPPGCSILDVLLENGIHVMTSCKNGVCGTCVTTVLAGEPDHRDEYFTVEERASNGLITLCVSRVHSGRLVLDF